ncbi:MAG: 50S ribosomal protein L21 [bacterium]
MYAVIETGGKQYLVNKGETIDVELLDAKDNFTFDNILLVADGEDVKIGAPYVAGAKVTAKVLGDNKDDKVTTFKYRHKVNYHRTIGHRQNYTRIQIEEIKHGA